MSLTSMILAIWRFSCRISNHFIQHFAIRRRLFAYNHPPARISDCKFVDVISLNTLPRQRKRQMVHTKQAKSVTHTQNNANNATQCVVYVKCTSSFDMIFCALLCVTNKALANTLGYITYVIRNR